MLPLPAGRDAGSCIRASRYVRHRPERSRLYQLVQEYYPALVQPKLLLPAGHGRGSVGLMVVVGRKAAVARKDISRVWTEWGRITGWRQEARP